MQRWPTTVLNDKVTLREFTRFLQNAKLHAWVGRQVIPKKKVKFKPASELGLEL